MVRGVVFDQWMLLSRAFTRWHDQPTPRLEQLPRLRNRRVPVDGPFERRDGLGNSVSRSAERGLGAGRQVWGLFGPSRLRRAGVTPHGSRSGRLDVEET